MYCLRQEGLRTQSKKATGPQGLRRLVGIFFFSVALLFSGWLLLGLFGVVPLILQFPGESSVRTHASAAVLFFMFAAWGFWES